MEEIDSRDLSSSSDSEEEKPSSIKGKKVYRLFGRERPLHMVLGGGKHADVILWRDKKVSAGILGGATAIWFLFEVLEYHFVSLICHGLILGSALLFLWSNAASFLSRSLPEIPELRIPEAPVVKITAALRIWINKSLALLRDVASGRDMKKFLAVIVGLWIMSVVGRYCEFLTVLYTFMVVAFSAPRFYEKYEDQVDAFGEKAEAEFWKQYAVFDAKVLSKIPKYNKKMA
ncbi:reticulon-like protein B2 [Salvia miltiorrhiza]|uniref:reticulon-like protein B2 n=1 Tax=Salvia miltiorrhiza TaxID=226208 RepID=UPI0025ACEC85|nr:reticulon-like protein B2 [Salvia miltiorrhiza]